MCAIDFIEKYLLLLFVLLSIIYKLSAKQNHLGGVLSYSNTKKKAVKIQTP